MDYFSLASVVVASTGGVTEDCGVAGVTVPVTAAGDAVTLVATVGKLPLLVSAPPLTLTKIATGRVLDLTDVFGAVDVVGVLGVFSVTV
mgnify:CR=1 FL=1